MKLVRNSGLFDSALYSKSAGLRGSDEQLIRHYLAKGERQGWSASREFDLDFYKTHYPDVVKSGKSPLLHYIQHGSAEGRHPSRESSSSDAGRIGRTEMTQEELNSARRAVAKRFDRRYYRANAGLVDDAVDEITHYLTVGRYAGFDPAGDFSVNYYLDRYPDVARSGADPFLHFVLHGKGEGRVGRPDFSKRTIKGARRFDQEKSTLIIINHEASRTGAPLVGLELARHFSPTYNVITYSGREGELVREFADTSTATVVGIATEHDAEYLLRHLKHEYGASAAILNSVETAAFATAALNVGLPSVALLHEFAEYSFPKGKMAKVVASVDRIVVPAQLILDSVQREVTREFGRPANNLAVRPQGCLPRLPRSATDADLTAEEILVRLGASADAKPPVVLGAGAFHMRKGVELFVQTADEVRRRFGGNARFVWVGDGYNPQSDSAYSVWISEAVKRLGLEDVVFFFPLQGSLDAFFDVADVFYLSSRLDPFPNVVLDALEVGKSVVCFENATGSAELFATGQAHGAAVKYCDVNAAADAIVRILGDCKQEHAEHNRGLVSSKFNFQDYAAYIQNEVEAAIGSRLRLEKSVRTINASGLFDAEFHDGQAVGARGALRACRNYVARSSKGLLKFNPRPGFSDGAYRSRHTLDACQTALDHAVETKGPSGDAVATHRCVVLQPQPREAFPGRIALHLHLHYPDLAPEFVTRLRRVTQRIDIFVTTTSAHKRAELEHHFLDYRNGRTTVVQVPNQGRDIGPFLIDLKRELGESGYDVVGHFHGKRSAAVDRDMGDRWRSFLLGTLLGDAELLPQLLGLFEDDAQLGLVFAEDRHAVGWDSNFEIAQALARQMEPSPELPAFPGPFPLGTMFWARPRAIAPLWRLDLRTSDLPKEPLPYDGTILHAIERMLPAVCEAAGLSWCTVHDRSCSW